MQCYASTGLQVLARACVFMGMCHTMVHIVKKAKWIQLAFGTEASLGLF